ncbi:MAG: hypothetical protein JWP91_1964 [Fibrobacteres bacterium]|nr:hypothetical protein [Fibrobacterota bacterium]
MQPGIPAGPDASLERIRAEATSCLPPTATNVWSNDARLLEAYRKRCRRETEEMTCAAQAAEILAPLVAPGETLLDAGCAGGYYHWSFESRGVPVEYHGLDYTPECIALAREEMGSAAGLPAERFIPGSIESLDRAFDNVLCFNVLTHNAHFGKPLEALLRCARKRILIRESLGDALSVDFRADAFIDEGKRHLRTYFNTYPRVEVERLMDEAGFTVTRIRDRRTGDGTETVCGVPAHWRILLGEKRR